MALPTSNAPSEKFEAMLAKAKAAKPTKLKHRVCKSGQPWDPSNKEHFELLVKLHKGKRFERKTLDDFEKQCSGRGGGTVCCWCRNRASVSVRHHPFIGSAATTSRPSAAPPAPQSAPAPRAPPARPADPDVPQEVAALFA